MPDIFIINESSVVDDADLTRWTKAVQRQLDEHLTPFWGVSARLENLPKGTPRPSGEWWMVILDDTDMATALGYHDIGDQGQPMGKVFARTTLGFQDQISRVLSHETLELLVDPKMVRLIELADADYLVEVCDPVYLPSQGYVIDDVLVNDFATPAYYHYNTDTRYDHLRLLPGPCPTMIHGSYLMYRQPGGAWDHKQLLEIPEGPERDRLRYRSRPVPGSRRFRRIGGRAHWINSTAAPPAGS